MTQQDKGVMSSQVLEALPIRCRTVDLSSRVAPGTEYRIVPLTVASTEMISYLLLFNDCQTHNNNVFVVFHNLIAGCKLHNQ